MTAHTHRAPSAARSRDASGSWYRNFSPATSSRYWAAIARIFIGFTFLWAFLDKNFGWEFTTPSGSEWMFGTGDGDPTAGFLRFGTNPDGPFADFYADLRPGQAPDPTHWTNWLFMAGLLGIGIALVVGIFLRIGAISGAVLLMLMYFALAPWANSVDPDTGAGSSTNPVVDDHLIYSVVLILLMLFERGRTLGLGRPWQSTRIVRRLPWLA